MLAVRKYKSWLIKVILLLWGVQIIWLAWHFAPEARDVAQRMASGEVGAAVRREDPIYLWSRGLSLLIPPHATYVLVDNYEAGKEIEIAYYLAPRRHILMPPEVPAPFLFYALHEEQASFLVVRDQQDSPGPGVQAAADSQAAQPVELPGPGRVYRIDYRRLHWGFYD